ncbi:MAG: type II toxin-antitoxin system VapC family toxin [Prochlorotrichaceae cyanobacterium]
MGQVAETWLSLVDKNDRFHTASKSALARYKEPLITTWCVVTETCYLLLTRKGTIAPVRFIRSLENGAAQIFDLELHHTSRISELMEQYQSLPMDLTDASLVILAEHLGQGRIFSVDQRDFNAYRWKNKHPFENLLFL